MNKQVFTVFLCIFAALSLSDAEAKARGPFWDGSAEGYWWYETDPQPRVNKAGETKGAGFTAVPSGNKKNNAQSGVTMEEHPSETARTGTVKMHRVRNGIYRAKIVRTEDGKYRSIETFIPFR